MLVRAGGGAPAPVKKLAALRCRESVLAPAAIPTLRQAQGRPEQRRRSKRGSASVRGGRVGRRQVILPTARECGRRVLNAPLDHRANHRPQVLSFVVSAYSTRGGCSL